MNACTVLPVVLDIPTITVGSALLCLGCVAYCWLRTWGLLVRVAALEMALSEQQGVLTREVKRRAAHARWDSTAADDDPAIRAAIAKAASEVVGDPQLQP